MNLLACKTGHKVDPIHPCVQHEIFWYDFIRFTYSSYLQYTLLIYSALPVLQYMECHL
jgi:hypothetical protein